MINFSRITTVMITCIACSGAYAEAQTVNQNAPQIKLLVQYAETIGKLAACGPIAASDETETLASGIAELEMPGFGAWLFGERAAYESLVLSLAQEARLTAMATPCAIAPLQDSYRILLGSISTTLKNRKQ